MHKEWQIDRSRILDYQHCPRKRYYGFHFNEAGIQRKSKSLPLVFGGAFHEGMEVLLSSGPNDVNMETGCVTHTPYVLDKAVARALQFIDQSFASRGVDLGEGESASLYALNEQKAIAEGLIRGWWAYEGERFLSDFEVLEVEQEGRAELGDGITLLFRPDAVVRERLTNDLYIVSWKTESSHGAWSMQRATTDMQSMSEVWGVENKKEFCSICHGSGVTDGGEACTDCWGKGKVPMNVQVEGVLYKFAVKGTRKMDDYLGFKVQDTPLAYGWTRKGADGSTEWAWRYKWASEEEGRKFEQLPKGFHKVSIWDNYPGGVKAWVEALAGQTVRPFHLNALEGLFPQALPVSRRGDEIESWRRQVVGQEKRVRAGYGTAMSPERLALDVLWPQHTHSCFSYNSRCPFYDICFTPAIAADPIASGLYQIRIANHPEKGDEE